MYLLLLKQMRKKEIIVGFKYVLKEKLGKGSFGQIYKGIERHTCKEVAIKMEPCSQHSQQLLGESKILSKLQGGKGIPQVFWSGTQGAFNVMVMEYLGDSLEKCRRNCAGKFSLSTTLAIADQLIERIEYIHNKNYLHRDIKPENFLIGGRDKLDLIYLIDFGLAHCYKNSTTGNHIVFRSGQSLVGTALYSSLNVHLGIEQSRRDDLESIGYLLVLFAKGGLPWHGIKLLSQKEKQKVISL